MSPRKAVWAFFNACAIPLAALCAALVLVAACEFGGDDDDDIEAECCLDQGGASGCCPEGMQCDQNDFSNGCIPGDSDDDSGGDDTGGSCVEPGDTCDVNGDCCPSDAGDQRVCVQDALGDGEARCAAQCTQNQECVSRCCCELESGGGACCHGDFCN